MAEETFDLSRDQMLQDQSKILSEQNHDNVTEDTELLPSENVIVVDKEYEKQNEGNRIAGPPERPALRIALPKSKMENDNVNKKLNAGQEHGNISSPIEVEIDGCQSPRWAFERSSSSWVVHVSKKSDRRKEEKSINARKKKKCEYSDHLLQAVAPENEGFNAQTSGDTNQKRWSTTQWCKFAFKILGLLLYVTDVGFDAANGINYLQGIPLPNSISNQSSTDETSELCTKWEEYRHPWWGTLTFLIIWSGTLGPWATQRLSRSRTRRRPWLPYRLKPK